MLSRDQKRLEKILLAMLGHEPDLYGLVPEPGGWFPAREVQRALSEEPGFPHPTPRALEQFITLFRPSGLEWHEGRLRAEPSLQHPGIDEFRPVSPPEILFVGVRPKAHAHVLKFGLKPAGQAQGVILAREEDLALRIARRRDPAPVLAKVLAREAEAAGTVFRACGQRLYLATELDPQWIQLPPLPAAKEPKKAKPEKPRPQEPSAPKAEDMGAFFLRPGSDNKRPDERARRKGKGKHGEPDWKEARRRTRRR